MVSMLLTLTLVLIVSAIALIANVLLTKLAQSSEKDMVAHFDNGRVEEFSIGYSAKQSEVLGRLHEALSFEAEVRSVISDKLNLATQDGMRVDFIVETSKGPIAVEVKVHLSPSSAKQIERYLEEDSRVKNLVFVLKQPPVARAVDAIGEYLKNGRVSLVLAGSDIENRLREELS